MYHEEGTYLMASLDWTQCLAVESIPGKVSGAWVFRDTRLAVSVVFQNLEAGATVDEIVEWFDISKDEVIEILQFVSRSVAVPPSARALSYDAHPL